MGLSTFRLKKRTPVEGSHAAICEYVHESGAKLIVFENTGTELSFGVVFKTVPYDSTGVFHIIEHSIACGSEKYPLLSPVQYMMKHSMRTYINAITFPGKTAYMCSSCNEKDFSNLMDVLLDAAFHPLLSETTFRREGWHAEKKGGIYVPAGVVYSEMQGNMSSEMSVIYTAVCADMYPDSHLCFSAGGLPSEIPGLTYEKYLQTYSEFYTPENCVFFLCGGADFKGAMDKIDSCLNGACFRGEEKPYPVQKPVKVIKEHRLAEELCGGESVVVCAYNICDYGDEESFYGAMILADYLLDKDSSFLKKHIKDNKLAKNAEVFFIAENQQAFCIMCRGATDAAALPCEIQRAVNAHIEEGFNKKALKAILSRLEFGLREELANINSGGINRALNIVDNVLNGVPSDRYLNIRNTMKKIAEGIDKGFFEDLSRRLFITNPHTAVSVFNPGGVKTCEREVSPSAPCVDKVKLWTEEEASKYMPCVKRSDIRKGISRRGFRREDNIMQTDSDSDDIVYLRYYFSLEGLTSREISAVSLFSSMLTELSTAKRSAAEIADEIRLNTGRLNAGVCILAPSKQVAKPYMRVNLAVAKEKAAAAAGILNELLTENVISESDVVGAVRRQLDETRMRLLTNGYVLASMGALSKFNAASRLTDAASGYDYYNFLKSAQGNEEEIAAFLRDIVPRIFVSSRLIYGVTGSWSPSYKLQLPKGGEPVKAVRAELLSEKRAYAVPSPVNCNVRVYNFKEDVPYGGGHIVAGRLLSLGYLWKNVREKGGAYGTGIRFFRNAMALVYSVNDPRVEETYSVFDELPAFIERYGADKAETEGAVLSVAAELLRPSRAEDESIRNEEDALCGIPADAALKAFEEVLAFSPEHLKAYGRYLDNSEISICSVGRAEKLKCGLFDDIINVV